MMFANGSLRHSTAVLAALRMFATAVGLASGLTLAQSAPFMIVASTQAPAAGLRVIE
jgi:hypothetical protein